MKKYIWLLIIPLLLLTGCDKKITIDEIIHEDYNKLPENAYITINKEIEVFTEPNIKDIVDTNMELTDIKLDTETIGENTQLVEYTYEGKTSKYNLKYTVVDKTAPIFLSAATYRTIQIHDDDNPCDSINIADNYTSIPTCEIIGDYNYEQIGTYKVKYQIKDESNNINEKDLTINIVKELPSGGGSSGGSTDSGLSFSYLKNKYAESNTEFGIDISKWQGDLTVDNFREIKNAGATFVMMRIAVSNKPEEALATDSKYKNNIKNAKEAGLKVGVYVYNTAINEEMGKETAQYVLKELNGESLDFPIVFDWENWSKFRTYQISIHELNKTFLAFADEIEKNNYKAMLYGSKHYLGIMWEDKIKNNYPVWLAHYTSHSKTDYEGKYMMWQVCSDGIIPGIKGFVDVDILYK